MKIPKKCFKCEKEMKSVFTFMNNHFESEPSGGVLFIGQPCYGSKFDGYPDDSKWSYGADYTGEFVINVCDKCIEGSKSIGWAVTETKATRCIEPLKKAKKSK